jgi:serine/threonine protein phosphatase 1
MRHTLVVGDIHGCYDEFSTLLEVAGLSETDEILSLGDIVDRGPRVWETISFFMDGSNRSCILGNHERKNVNVLAGRTQPSLSQRITRVELGEERYESSCAYFATLENYRALDSAVVVHGYYEPGVSLSGQKSEVLTGVISGERHIYIQYQRKYGKPWYEQYDGDLPLIVGHHDYLGNGSPLIWNDRVWCLDTGCVHGKVLTGLLLPEFRIIQVKARRDYWTEKKSAYAHLVVPKPDRAILDERPQRSLICGKDLVSLGLKPGPVFEEIMLACRKMQDTGVITTKEEALAFARQYTERQTI